MRSASYYCLHEAPDLKRRRFGLSTSHLRNCCLVGQPSLAAITSMVRMAIVHLPDVHRRWRDINRRGRRVIDRRWWRVIDRRGRGDVHRLRCNRAANQSSNTESQ